MTTFLVTKHYRLTRKGPRWTVALYCICGTAFRMTADSEAVIDQAIDLIVREHQGEGHGSTDSVGASRARRKAEKAELEAVR
jgi:hypothetical protein